MAKMEPRGHLPQSWNVTLREPTSETSSPAIPGVDDSRIPLVAAGFAARRLRGHLPFRGACLLVGTPKYLGPRSYGATNYESLLRREDTSYIRKLVKHNVIINIFSSEPRNTSARKTKKQIRPPQRSNLCSLFVIIFLLPFTIIALVVAECPGSGSCCCASAYTGFVSPPASC